jgi:HAD superfamily hydrolase (TIGR01509 family)
MIRTHLVLFTAFISGSTLAVPAPEVKPLIAFDLHGVVFNLAPRKLAAAIGNISHKWTVAGMLINPRFWYKAYKAHKKTTVAEGIFYELCTTYPQLMAHKKDFITLSNAQTPNAETIAFIKNLKATGYTVALCSNIGAETLVDLQQKFPQELALFDVLFGTHAGNQYLSKSNPQFYTDFLQHVKQCGYNCPVIFIDDKASNTKKAQAAGMQAIHFKSAAQAAHECDRILV